MGRKKSKPSAKAKTKTTPRGPQPKSRQAPRSWVQEAVQAKFSLADEARWASNHRSSAFDSGKKLRFLKVDFVSAGLLEGTIPVKQTPPSPPSPADPSASLTAMANMAIRSPSPTPSVSSSSEDEVVFQGRGSTPFGQATAPSTAHTKPTPTLTNKSLPVPSLTEDRGSDRDVPHESASVSDEAAPQLTGSSTSDERTPRKETASSVKATVRVQDVAVATQADSDGESVIGDAFKSRLGDQSIWMTNTTPWASKSKPGIGWLPVNERPDLGSFLSGAVDPRAAAMDDYMQNVEDFGISGNSTFKPRNLDLSEGEDRSQQDNSDSEDLDDLDHTENKWDSENLRDLEGFSTSSDVIDKIERVVATRTRKSGPQYLVAYEGSTPDDLHWLPASFITCADELELIRAFEATRPTYDDSSDSDMDDSESLDEEPEDDEFNIEMSDEQIARVLQKQEELGLGSEEVVLYGGDASFGEPVTGQQAFLRPSKKRQGRSGPGKRSEPSFPSASAMADALDADPYNGFEVMDAERPSLRLRKRGRRGQMPAELSDSELNETLHASWEADRSKKRLKKAEREELRKQGLLGRNGKAPNLSAKYKDGFDLNQVIAEIRDFVFSDTQSLALPPMEAHRRAVIHQVVHQLNITSKSRGDGADRFTVLSKTSRTKTVDDDFFEALFEKKHVRARFSMVPKNSSRGKKPAKTVRPVVSYKDGETVGASAPELGPENFGHRLMQKMGWSQGMALGAGDNKGILQPIAHTVKTNKAGLK
ncbi:hypothetical protein K491DRAFT_296702 [Lophiostoma macrostomum CBS 122681]|uniref:Protein SQS1 n=1 Tax=Lophiostoma macrostomum CBS 122681 TaxID=1314788 RepID=A0A6A6TEJ2_9PLEO|nr:hypothetical protein K491DRAFT_296702 [Lophiostoma macrostomum CBS 122681]